MKNIVLASLMMLVLLSASIAQEGSLRIGVKVSPLISWMNPETRNYESEGIRIGTSFGIVGEYGLGSFYAFSTGLMITSMGGKLSYPVEIGDQAGLNERTYRLRYLEIPLLLKFQTEEMRYFSYFGKIGFSPGINMRARGDDRFRPLGIQDPEVNDDLDISNHISIFRLALVVGFGVEYSLGGRTALTGGLTYNNGFTNVLATENSGNPSSLLNYLGLSIGIMF